MRTTVKATYTLLPQTIRKLEQLAERWGVTKSEVIRRSIDQLSCQDPIHDQEKPDPLLALKQYQAAMHLTREERARWIDDVRKERHARHPS